jgi:hypothetical protein
MGDIRLREDTLRAICTYKFILTGINKEGVLSAYIGLKETPLINESILIA